MHRRSFLRLVCSSAPLLGSLNAAEALADTCSASRYGMVIDLRRCVGCQSCSVTCSVENQVPIGRFRASVGEFVIQGDSLASASIATLPRLCNHCEAPACVPACPVGATYKSDSGLVLVDSKKCLGCGFCVQACPYEARYLNPATGTADKCTFCVHRIEAGLLPACVENCVGGARIFGDLRDPHSLVHQTLAKHKGQIRTLYPGAGTKPSVYYINLDSFLQKRAKVGEPMAGGGHA
jgi:tetrathionate reductase subunit B